jgi:hypothetical protein
MDRAKMFDFVFRSKSLAYKILEWHGRVHRDVPVAFVGALNIAFVMAVFSPS